MKISLMIATLLWKTSHPKENLTGWELSSFITTIFTEVKVKNYKYFYNNPSTKKASSSSLFERFSRVSKTKK